MPDLRTFPQRVHIHLYAIAEGDVGWWTVQRQSRGCRQRLFTREQPRVPDRIGRVINPPQTATGPVAARRREGIARSENARTCRGRFAGRSRTIGFLSVQQIAGFEGDPATRAGLARPQSTAGILNPASGSDKRHLGPVVGQAPAPPGRPDGHRVRGIQAKNHTPDLSRRDARRCGRSSRRTTTGPAPGATTTGESATCRTAPTPPRRRRRTCRPSAPSATDAGRRRPARASAETQDRSTCDAPPAANPAAALSNPVNVPRRHGGPRSMILVWTETVNAGGA